MKLVEVVILVGSQCLSPVHSAPGLTEAGKVPCAVLIRQDPQTADVEFVPQAAATDPMSWPCSSGLALPNRNPARPPSFLPRQRRAT